MHKYTCGEKYGSLTLLECSGAKGEGHCRYKTWICFCECGKRTEVTTRYLKNSPFPNCGCINKLKRRANVNKIHRVKNSPGDRYGRLEILQRANEKSRDSSAVWECLCDCGKKVKVSSNRLRQGTTRSCGCLSRERTSVAKSARLEGQRFGRLLVKRKDGSNNGQVIWECQCDCGNISFVPTGRLNSGGTRSCGCIAREKARQRAGSNHPNWNPSLSDEDRINNRKSLKNKQWTVKILEKDFYTCKICGQVGGNLNAHHLSSYSAFPEERFSLENGVCLCEKCHRLFHDKFGYRDNTRIQFLSFLNNPQNYCSLVQRRLE